MAKNYIRPDEILGRILQYKIGKVKRYGARKKEREKYERKYRK
jgi:hypothetical protein